MGFLDEIEEIKSKGVEIYLKKNLILSEAANLILPFHREWMKLEKMQQEKKK